MKSLPRAIAGWPCRWTEVALGPVSVGLFTVDRLEERLDRERLLRDDDYEPPYWALVWSGAREVAGWLAERGRLDGATVLDVGCGLGVVALTAAQLGARVTAVDRDAAALAFGSASAARAGCEVEWIEGDVVDAVAGRRFDVVVAAEILYERDSFGTLADALGRSLAPGGALLLADAFRVDTGPFYAELTLRGLACREERSCRVLEEETPVRIRLGDYRRA